MPRVNTATKSTRGKSITCDKCSKLIEVGQQYYFWKFRYGAKHTRHTACGRPKPSELTNSKMSGVYAAIESAEALIEAAGDESDLATALRDCADSVDEVRSEYQSGLDNMPDGLRDAAESGQTGETMSALEEFSAALQSAADDIESSPWEEEQDVDSEENDEARDEWFDDLRNKASSALGELSI